MYKIKLNLIEKTHLQNHEVLPIKLKQKKTPHPPCHMKKEGEANIWKPQLIKVLQQEIWQKKTPPILFT